MLDFDLGKIESQVPAPQIWSISPSPAILPAPSPLSSSFFFTQQRRGTPSCSISGLHPQLPLLQPRSTSGQTPSHLCRVLQLSSSRRASTSFDPFSVDVWDQFNDFPFPSSAIAKSFPEFARETSALVNMRIDWKETPEAHVFKADLPGIKKEEVKVEIEDDSVLQISGERSKEEEEKNDVSHMFRLPENAKLDGVKAGMENRVLTVTVPKEEIEKHDVQVY